MLVSDLFLQVILCNVSSSHHFGHHLFFRLYRDIYGYMCHPVVTLYLLHLLELTKKHLAIFSGDPVYVVCTVYYGNYRAPQSIYTMLVDHWGWVAPAQCDEDHGGMSDERSEGRGRAAPGARRGRHLDPVGQGTESMLRLKRR